MKGRGRGKAAKAKAKAKSKAKSKAKAKAKGKAKGKAAAKARSPKAKAKASRKRQAKVDDDEDEEQTGQKTFAKRYQSATYPERWSTIRDSFNSFILGKVQLQAWAEDTPGLAYMHNITIVFLNN